MIDFNLIKALEENRNRLGQCGRLDAFVLGWEACRKAHRRKSLIQKYREVVAWAMKNRK